MKFSPLVERIAGEGADAWVIHYAARAAQERGEDVIVLSVGDPDLEMPTAVLMRAIDSLRAGDIRYTPAAGRPALRDAIAKHHTDRTGQAVDGSQVVFLSGAQNALYAAAMCVAGPGDEVLAVEPLYPSYPATIQASGATLKRVSAPPARDFRIDLDAVEAAITTRTRALFFASPNNPSGVIMSAEELAVIGDLAQRHRLWVVADEVYAGLAPQGRVPSLAARLPEQVVTISSLSKSHSMPGLRAGWLVAPPAMARHAEALAMCMLFGLPGFIQDASVIALEMSGSAEARIRDFCAIRRDAFLTALQDVAGIRCRVPEAGMFTLIDVRDTGLSGYEFMVELYESERVAVLDGGAFGRATSGFVRLCFATDMARLLDAAARIRRFAATLARCRSLSHP